MTPALDSHTGVGSAGWEERNDVQVAGVIPGMDAEKKGIRKGDVLIAIDGEPIHSMTRLHEVIRSASGAPVSIRFLRGRQELESSIQPAYSKEDSRWMIGVQLERPIVITQLSFPDALRESVKQNVRSASLIYQFLQGLVERRMSAKSLEGPIGIARLSGDAAREGATAFFGLMAMVSLNSGRVQSSPDSDSRRRAHPAAAH